MSVYGKRLPNTVTVAPQSCLCTFHCDPYNVEPRQLPSSPVGADSERCRMPEKAAELTEAAISTCPPA